MISLKTAATAALFALVLAACATRPAANAPAPATTTPATPPVVLLVSIDGFRADYLDLGITPHLARLARDGVRAQWMNPSYPTLTFPNHYSIVTGLRPDHHGIVHNTMHDAALGTFRIGNADAVGDGRWWDDGEPVWVSAERAGIPTATLFWPGSEAAIDGVRPSRWLRYDGDMPAAARVDTVLGWLDKPASSRPRFATLYFGALDHAGHDHGPESAQARAALRAVDAAIGRLLDGLTARGLDDAINLIVVSDHGMATVAPGHAIALEDMVDAAHAEAVTGGQSVGFAPRPGHERAAAAQLLGRHAHYQCWRKAELPARWHYGTHARIPAIVCQMDEGWSAAPRKRLGNRGDGVRGSHGFDPALVSMRTIFLARGPAFREGATVPAFDNVDVYPLLMHLLGLPPKPNDGDADAFSTLRPM